MSRYNRPSVAQQIRSSQGEIIGSLNNALDIHDANSHRSIVNRYAHQHTATVTTLAADSAINAYQITVASATGFAVGNYIHINTTTEETTHPKITAIAGAVFTLDRRLDNVHLIGDSVTKSILDMSTTAGTMAAPQEYWAGPPAGSVWHLTRLLFSMVHGTAGDLGLFGNLTALTNGAVLRVRLNGIYTTLTDWKTNADFKSDMYDVDFDARSGGGGVYGTSGRGTFKASGSVVRLDGDTSDRIEVYIQDDITALNLFRMKFQGHLENA